MNPNTGEPVDEWQCAINFVPFLMIENSQQQRQTGAAVESFRNESIRQTNTLTELLVHSVNQTVALTGVQEADIKLLKPE